MGNSELDKLLDELTGKVELEHDPLGKPVRFSLTLPKHLTARIDILGDKLGMSRQAYIQKIIEAATLDMEERMSLVTTKQLSFIGEDVVQYTREYQNEILLKLGFKPQEHKE
ncbi:hypothetical protein ACFOQM_23605 [Paenibacillus sp. GCM10012307]|uniref:Uncharacterized protein n=1 Tax=Paenibacillus roseus TaxID=2798579 RepID=A0A934MN89_9BACL|nr:hypothetical protein [Paenibacillus roseus]MBJ6364210.1 hypothetical protein [Paenibacillus roseus]